MSFARPRLFKPNPDRFFARLDRLGALTNLNAPPLFDPSELQTLPQGSLGRALSDFLTQNQIPPLLTGPRRKQLHDVIHVVTGYGSDRTGELEIQAFLWGATRVPLHLIVAAGLFALEDPTAPSPQVLAQRLRRAHQRGAASTLDPDRWHPETQWHLPLAQVCHSLGIQSPFTA